MSDTLRILSHAEKQLSRLNSPIYDSLKTKISAIRDTPGPQGCNKLREREGWRIRIGDYRVIYKINDIEKTVTVIEIGHRSEVYR